MLEAQLEYSLEAHKCGLGTLTREALVIIGSGPNKVRGHNLGRRENAVLVLPTFLPSSKWPGDAVDGIMPINTYVRQLSGRVKHNSLHILEFFGGIGLGAFGLP